MAVTFLTNEDKDELQEQIAEIPVAEEVANQLDGAKADIVTELINQIGGMPVFGTVNDDNTITVTSTLADGDYVLMYENDEGALEEIGTITVGNGEASVTFTNLANTTLATDATLTATSQGWIENKRINSSYNVIDADNVHISNIISVNDKEILRVKGFNLSATNGRIFFLLNGSCIYYLTNTSVLSYATTCDGDYTEVTIAKLIEAIQKNTSYTSFDSFRVSGVLSGTKEDVIITLDEEIS